jgi:hypothetical protein
MAEVILEYPSQARTISVFERLYDKLMILHRLLHVSIAKRLADENPRLVRRIRTRHNRLYSCPK